MYPCLEIRIIVFVKGYFIHPSYEISLHKNNSTGSPNKDTPWTGSCYNTTRVYPPLLHPGLGEVIIWKLRRVKTYQLKWHNSVASRCSPTWDEVYSCLLLTMQCSNSGVLYGNIKSMVLWFNKKPCRRFLNWKHEMIL